MKASIILIIFNIWLNIDFVYAGISRKPERKFGKVLNRHEPHRDISKLKERHVPQKSKRSMVRFMNALERDIPYDLGDFPDKNPSIFRMMAPGPWLERSEIQNMFEKRISDIIGEKASYSRANQATATIDAIVEYLPQMLEKLAKDETYVKYLAKRSRKLPNGFQAIPFYEFQGYVVRLHMFNQKSTVDGLHSHKWCFESRCLAGNLASENWEVCRKDEHGAVVREKSMREKEESGAAKVTVLDKVVYLKKVSDETCRVGKSYFMDDSTIHRVMTTNEFTSTIIITHPKSTTAYLYDEQGAHGEEGEVQEQNPMSEGEVVAFLNKLKGNREIGLAASGI